MLQHPGGAWTWGGYLVVHPAGNPDMAGLSARYRELLADPSTFASMTIEELLDAGVLAASTTKALRNRYLPDDAKRHGRRRDGHLARIVTEDRQLFRRLGESVAHGVTRS